jgi:MoaA/NifB/PqqE/SkfB family radical SAM enzyme
LTQLKPIATDSHQSLFERIRGQLRKAFIGPSPTIPLFQRVVVELQSHCNRSCYFCCRESDSIGKRKNPDGSSVKIAMPTEQVIHIFDELESLGFTGHITFHQLSEAFLDKRLITLAREARRRGMRPYVHTNGDVLKESESLSRESAEVFEYIVIGLYDYTSIAEREAEKLFWESRLQGTLVLFSLAENIYSRTHSPKNEHMSAVVRHTHPNAVCAQPLMYLLIHYNGDVACCCEDMYGELLRFNVFESSIREVWRSKRHAEVVTALARGERSKFQLCKNCTMGPSSYTSDPMQAIKHLGG